LSNYTWAAVHDQWRSAYGLAPIGEPPSSGGRPE
jgi:hypothetical protein